MHVIKSSKLADNDPGCERSSCYRGRSSRTARNGISLPAAALGTTYSITLRGTRWRPDRAGQPRDSVALECADLGCQAVLLTACTMLRATTRVDVRAIVQAGVRAEIKARFLERRTGDALEDAHDADGGEVEGREVARHAALQEHPQQEQRRRPAQHLRSDVMKERVGMTVRIRWSQQFSGFSRGATSCSRPLPLPPCKLSSATLGAAAAVGGEPHTWLVDG